jgi:hypothetical protein
VSTYLRLALGITNLSVPVGSIFAASLVMFLEKR